MRATADKQIIVVIKEDGGPFSGKQVVLKRELPNLGHQRSWMAHPVGNPDYTAIVFQSRLGIVVQGEIPQLVIQGEPMPVFRKLEKEELAIVKEKPTIKPEPKDPEPKSKPKKPANKPKEAISPSHKLASLTAAWLVEQEAANAAKARFTEAETVAKARRAEYQQCCQKEASKWNELQHAMLELRPERIWPQTRGEQ